MLFNMAPKVCQFLVLLFPFKNYCSPYLSTFCPLFSLLISSLLALISNFHIRSMDDARLAVRTMAILHAVCERYPTVHYSEFYNDALNDYCMNSKEVSHQHLN